MKERIYLPVTGVQQRDEHHSEYIYLLYTKYTYLQLITFNLMQSFVIIIDGCKCSLIFAACVCKYSVISVL